MYVYHLSVNISTDRKNMSETDLCRLCVNLTGPTNSGKLFERSQRKLLQQIALLTGLQLKYEKHLPELICKPCEQQTLQAYRFRERCIRTQKFFAKQINQLTELPSTQDEMFKLYHKHKSKVEIISPIEEDVIADINMVKLEEAKDELQEDTKQSDVAVAMSNSMFEDKVQNGVIIMPNITEILLKGEFIASEDSGSSASASNHYNPLDEKDDNSPLSSDDRSLVSDDSEFVLLEPEISLVTEGQLAKEKKIQNKSFKKNPLNKTRKPKIEKMPRKEKKPKKEPKVHNLICDQCGKHFKCPRKLEDHLLRHAGDKQHQCKICPQRFYSYQALHRHTRTHSGEKPYGCRYCERHFMDDSSRVRHERVHTNTRPFICSHCGKAFTVSPSLKEHMRIHTGERAFTCKICNVSFTLKAHLVTHYRSMTHKQNEEKQQNSHNQPNNLVT